MSDLTKLGIVLNPTAGRNRAFKIEKHLIGYLRQRNIVFQLEKTKGPKHATDISSQMCKELDVIVAVGGDGTVNEVATGIVGSSASMAIIPIGSGNDFNKMIGIPSKISLAIDTIISGTKKIFDLGRVRIKNLKGTAQTKHFVNTLGIGIDAEIANEAKQIKYLRGLPLYLVAAIKVLGTYLPKEYNISDGTNLIKERAYLICAGIGNYEGGGFKMLPNADPGDAKLDICLIRKMPIWKSIKVIPKIINGTHGKNEMISMWKTEEIKISSNLPFIIHGDGEIFEENALEVAIDLIPKAISVIVPRIKNIAL